MVNISVIMATYNRCASLKDTLNNLLVQEVAGSFDYEILVVDNNSKDKTKEVINSYLPGFKGKLKYLFELRQGKSYALNTAVKEAKGEIIAFCDDDVIVDPMWIFKIGKFFKEFDCDAMGGRVLPLYTAKTPSWVIKNKDLLVGPVVRHDYGEDIKLYDRSLMRAFLGSNMAIKSGILNELGFFRTDLGPGQGSTGEDTDIFERLQKAGAKIYYNGQASVLHPVPEERITFRYLIKYYFVLGKYYTKKNLAELVKDKPVCYFGVPRYLLKAAVVNLIKMISLIWNINKGLPFLIKMSIAFGEGFEYRKGIRKEI
jgi:glucosyl-dolichyl phosphate glucuronosyltransferase